MDSGMAFGGLLVVFGAAQLWASYRTPAPRRTDLILMGVSFAALGISRLLEHSDPVLRIGSSAAAAVPAIVFAYRKRRETPRAFVVITTLMIFSLALTVLSVFVDIDSILRPVARPLFWAFMAALFVGGLWAVFTVVRAVARPFRPITPNDD